MNGNWITAAENFRRANATQQVLELERTATAVRGQALQNDARRQQEIDIDHGTTELEQFMYTHGQVVTELLHASNRRIIFGENNEGGGYGVVYFIDGNGLQQSIEAMGTWVVYSKETVRGPRLTPINARQAIEAAVRYEGVKATEVVEWLRKELDKIANSAPVNK